MVCLFQFAAIGNFVRKNLRNVLKQLHFIDDEIAFFDIPALEIDTDVDVLFVVRGVTSRCRCGVLLFMVWRTEKEGKTKDEDGEAVFEGTPLLKAASRDGDTRWRGMMKMTSQMTDGNLPDHSTAWRV